MHYRHLGNYPPYSYFISFISQDKDENNAYNNSRLIKEWFAANGVTDILGPADILKRQDYYRYRLLYRGKDLMKMKELVNKLYEYRRENKQNDRLIIDVNPWGIDE
jgi:primosomal protein N' (replication factor Y)